MADLDPEVVAHLLEFVEQSGDFVGVSDPWGRLLYLNAAAAKRLGVADATGLTLADLFPLETFGFYYDVVRPQLLRTGTWSGEFLVKAHGVDAVPMYVSTTAKLGPGGETNGGVVYAHELLRAARPPTEDTDVDKATGLLTSTAFNERAGAALDESIQGGDACVVVLADIGGITDDVAPAGTQAHDGIMRAVAGRLSRLARTIDVVGRLDENRVALLLRGVRNEAEALRLAATATEALVDPPVRTAGDDIVVSVTSGVALARPGDNLAELLERAAATAPYRPSRTPRIVPAQRAATASDPVTLDQFRLGMSHGDVVPYVQPMVEIRSERLIGYRAFARWHHRNLGVLDPTAFVDMIAESELATVVDLFVAREAAAVLLLMARGAPLHLSTPVSRRLIADVRTEQNLSEIADAFYVSPSQISLQVARHLLDDCPPALSDALYSLRAAGFQLVLTGVDNEAAVEAAIGTFDGLQIARRLTHAAETDSEARTTLTEVIRRARTHDLAVGAAGVDRTEQQDILIEAGCEVAYGSLFGAAEPANTVG